MSLSALLSSVLPQSPDDWWKNANPSKPIAPDNATTFSYNDPGGFDANITHHKTVPPPPSQKALKGSKGFVKKLTEFTQKQTDDDIARRREIGHPGTGESYGGDTSQWGGIVDQALKELGVYSPQNHDIIMRRMFLESSGNPNAINKWDSNWKAGHPSQGLMQVIPSTFDEYSGAYHDRGIYDPMANTYAGINYALHQYKGDLNRIDPRTRPGGY